jgi:hypothetical protein
MFAMLLYSPVVKAASIDCVIHQTSFSSGHAYIVPQERNNMPTISLHAFFSSILCSIVQVDSVHVPTVKSILLFTTLFKEQAHINSSLWGATLRHFSTCLSDPVAYYIFGLRKIIV